MKADAVPLPTRQAALLAHGLPPDDREWLLGRLEPMQRGLLAELLRELQTLSIPPDHDLLEQVLRDHRPAPVPTTTERLARLDTKGISELVQLLQSEPPAVASRLLGIRDWPWRSEVAAALSQSVRDLVVDAHGPSAPALDAALVEELAAALAGALRSPPPVPAGGRWTEIFRRRGRA
jgi:hypothetical protein